MDYWRVHLSGECNQIPTRVLRKQAPERGRPFRVPALGIIGPLTMLGTVFLFFNLPTAAMLVLPIWTAIGFLVYFGYSRSRSHLGRGIIEVPVGQHLSAGRTQGRRRCRL